MKYLSLFLFFTTFLITQIPANAYEKSNSKRAMEMERLEEAFITLIILTETKPAPYQEMETTLGEMKKTALKLKDDTKKEALKIQLDQLIAKMESVQKSIASKKISAVKKDADLLADQCFRCHSAHQPIPKI